VNKDHGAFLVELDPKHPKKFTISKILCENGDSNSKNMIPNRTFYSPAPFNVGNSKPSSFKDTIADVIKNLKIFGFRPRKSKVTPDKALDLNFPILVLTLFGTVPYSRLEFNTRQLRDAILKELDILDARVYSASIQSELDGITLEGEEELSIDEIEKKVFSLMIDSNELYAPVKNDILNLMSDIKSQLQESDADPKQLKNQIKEWYGAHVSELNYETQDKKSKEKARKSRKHPTTGKEDPKLKESAKVDDVDNVKGAGTAGTAGDAADMDDLLGDLTDYENTGDDEFDF